MFAPRGIAFALPPILRADPIDRSRFRRYYPHQLSRAEAVNMKTSFAAACILAVLIFSVPAASTQAQQMRTFHCIATSIAPGATHTTIYVSQVFPMEISQHAAINGAWATYIKATYHLTTISITRCDQLGVNPTMQERILTAEETSWKNQGWEVVHVNWRPGQAGAAPTPAASLYSATPSPPGIGEPHAPSAQPAAASGAGEPSASYCYSDDRKPTIYFSDAFDTAGLPSSAAWSTAFTKMLAQKYAYKGTVTCKTVTTIVSAQSAMLEQRDALQGKQFVDTDWTYEPPHTRVRPIAARGAGTPACAPPLFVGAWHAMPGKHTWLPVHHPPSIAGKNVGQAYPAPFAGKA